jgi:hypothetical protein
MTFQCRPCGRGSTVKSLSHFRREFIRCDRCFDDSSRRANGSQWSSLPHRDRGFGRFAAVTPPAATLLLSTSMNSGAVAASGGASNNNNNNNNNNHNNNNNNQQ